MESRHELQQEFVVAETVISPILSPNVAVYKTSPYPIQEQPPISDKNDAWHISLLQSWISLWLQLHSNPLPLIYSPTLQLCLDKLRVQVV